MSEVRPGSRDLFQEALLDEQVPEPLLTAEVPGLTRPVEEGDVDPTVDVDLMECLEGRWVPMALWGRRLLQVASPNRGCRDVPWDSILAMHLRGSGPRSQGDPQLPDVHTRDGGTALAIRTAQVVSPGSWTEASDMNLGLENLKCQRGPEEPLRGRRGSS